MLAPAPNHVLQLDKWCIAAATMTADEKRVYLSMRRREELARVETLERAVHFFFQRLPKFVNMFGYFCPVFGCISTDLFE